MTEESDRASVPRVEELCIDIGCTTQDEALEFVSPGDPVVFDSDFRLFGQGYVKARAIDDRLGCAVLCKLIEDEPPVDAWFAFTVQEEVGLRGAAVAANRLSPDMALVIEGTTAADGPDTEEHKRVCALGKGAVVPFMDRSTIYDRAMCEAIREAADRHGIPWQLKKYVSGGTDAAALQRSGAGVKVAAIAAPVRNIHSPCCVAFVSDCEAVYNLTREYMNYLGDEKQ
ncbi:hypothetical protein FACS1894171_2890 [Clostridia bacterium]|nr:hypothetical protein FACS1894171_2890 [Clostridia bacterium]